LLTDRHADRTLIYSQQRLEAVLNDLGGKEITSVLIEGGGQILGQALDERLIDKVQIYLAPLLTGGPVLAFPGRGAASSVEALRLTKMRYQSIAGDVCIIGYPFRKGAGERE
jgi:diaminohydroxyphosphoribosylaminopyrimidine deaminase/5-amino-6-(5-phosphoribosylamino)uracil reductase